MNTGIDYLLLIFLIFKSGCLIITKRVVITDKIQLFDSFMFDYIDRLSKHDFCLFQTIIIAPGSTTLFCVLLE